MLENTYEDNSNTSTSSVDLEESKIINRMQYIMSFGDYNIQYDFSLN